MCYCIDWHACITPIMVNYNVCVINGLFSQISLLLRIRNSVDGSSRPGTILIQQSQQFLSVIYYIGYRDIQQQLAACWIFFCFCFKEYQQHQSRCSTAALHSFFQLLDGSFDDGSKRLGTYCLVRFLQMWGNFGEDQKV